MPTPFLVHSFWLGDWHCQSFSANHTTLSNISRSSKPHFLWKKCLDNDDGWWWRIYLDTHYRDGSAYATFHKEEVATGLGFLLMYGRIAISFIFFYYPIPIWVKNSYLKGFFFSFLYSLSLFLVIMLFYCLITSSSSELLPSWWVCFEAMYH